MRNEVVGGGSKQGSDDEECWLCNSRVWIVFCCLINSSKIYWIKVTFYLLNLWFGHLDWAQLGGTFALAEIMHAYAVRCLPLATELLRKRMSAGMTWAIWLFLW